MDWYALSFIINEISTDNTSSNINEVIRSVLNFLFFFT